MLKVEMVSACRFSKEWQKGGSVSDTQDIGQEAGEVYRFGMGFAREDSQFGLRYPLRRLRALLRLPEQDAQELTELGRIVIQEGNVEEVADRIRQRQDASPLAVAIASIVQASALGREDSRRGGYAWSGFWSLCGARVFAHRRRSPY